MSINENTETLNYLRQISDVGGLEATTRFTRSFDQVNRFENWEDTFALAKYNRADQSIHFRREIGGFPVFSPFDFESVSEISIVESGVTELKLPLRFIRTPIAIPAEDEEGSLRELISGARLIEDIQNKVSEDTYAQIEDITIGYTWVESEENSQVVNFTPEWYISVSGTWLTYSEVMRLQEEATYGL